MSYQPPKITALAFSHHSNSEEPIPESLLLAIGRSNGDIDIWSPLNEWVHKIVASFHLENLILDSPRRKRQIDRRTGMGSISCLPKTCLPSPLFNWFINIPNRMEYYNRPSEAASRFQCRGNLVTRPFTRWQNHSIGL